ncbi:BatA domain-containing protein [Candidatus Woesearchaeota archaeon]|nr:BatA domain-containing protein [Candidatus Woesearchaeota archaeon]MBW3018261.1 BatA domain-containing protein [Candidatus Woesearchaeota archaeon]
MAWGNIIGLYALLALVPFIILYFIKPKPKEMIFPSLLFLFKQKGSVYRSSFFRNFLKDLLFLLQLIVLVLLAVSVAEPMIKVDQTVITRNTVLVLDLSASMSADGVFDEMIKNAKGALSSVNSIIFAENTPLIALEEGSKGEALEILDVLKPKATSTNLGDSIALAGEMVDEGRVVVVSDFIVTEGPDPLVAKNLLESKGLIVDFINVGKNADNLAITDVKVTKPKTTIYFKNYYQEAKDVHTRIGSLEKTLRIKPNSIETISIATPPGLTKIEITDKDAMMADNFAYISTPENILIRVLLITNSESKFIESALTASPQIELTVATPPIVPEPNHDVVIFSDFDESLLLPGTYEIIENYVRKGHAVIFAAQDKMPQTSLLPVSIKGLKEEDNAVITTKIINKITRDIDFGSVNKYLETEPVASSVVVAAAGESPVLAMKELGGGSTVYYGIFDKDTDFKYSPSYPIFWNNLLNHLARSEDLNDFNFKTGTILALGTRQTVEAPSGPVTTNNLLLDEVGVYTFEEKKIVANLANEKESNIGKTETQFKGGKITEFGTTTRKVDKSIVKYLAIIALILILLELFVIKRRGEL